MSSIETALQGLDVIVEPLDFRAYGFHAQVLAVSEQLRPLSHALHSFGFFLETVTAVDRLSDETMQAVYLFNHYEQSMRLKVMIEDNREAPVFPSIGKIYPGAIWHERETGEFFGISFKDSPDSRNLLLPAETTFHPLRKDFRRPGQPLMNSDV